MTRIDEPSDPADRSERLMTARAAALPYRLKTSPYGSHARLLEALPRHGNGATVVDVGGGEGYLGNLLLARNFRVSCVAKSGSVASDLDPSIRVCETDLNRKVPSLEGRFDYAVCGDVLEHLVDPGRVLTWLRERLLPEGLLIASLPNSGHFFVRLNVLLGRFPENDRGLFDRTHLHFYAWRNWMDLFTGAGFSIERVTPTVIPFGLVWPHLDGGRVVKGLESLNFALACICKTFWAYQFVVVARPRIP